MEQRNNGFDEDEGQKVLHCPFCDDHPSEAGHYEVCRVRVGLDGGDNIVKLMLTCNNARMIASGEEGQDFTETAKYTYFLVEGVELSDGSIRRLIGDENMDFLDSLS